MSLWAWKFGVIKIKEEFQEEFGFLYRGEYEKISHSKMREIAEYFIEEPERCPTSALNHFGEYEVSNADGIYTFDWLYNSIHGQWEFIETFEELIAEIGIWIERKGWIED